MRIRQLTAYVVRLPLRRAFVHASAVRHESENVLVACELADGTQGWGEGVPRSYVTGETPAGCLEQLRETPLGDQLTGDCSSWSDVIGLCERFQPAAVRDDPRGCYGNALRCAVELSVLDAFGRWLGEPVSTVTRHFEPAAPIAADLPTVRYGAVIGSGSGSLRRKSLVRRLYGFRQCKVKVGKAGDDDQARLRTIRRWIGWGVDLRIDANEAWHASELGEKLHPLAAFGISCMEQPVPHAEVAALAPWRKTLPVPIMLDESLTSMPDARAAITGGTCDLFNIRLSKCGGFLASLRLAAVAHKARLGYQLGCHPGESGILSAAGRHWATSVAGIRYWEGSYDRHLLGRLVTNEDVTFGYGGWAPALVGPGLGVTINPAALQEVTVIQQHSPVM
jgi:L-alanine-DL-glutamate epimerase-like enolase superfamily enzyme